MKFHYLFKELPKVTIGYLLSQVQGGEASRVIVNGKPATGGGSLKGLAKKFALPIKLAPNVADFGITLNIKD